MVRRLCRKFIRTGEYLEDLFQIGTVGLLKAIEKYDPSRGVSLAAYATPVIVGEIKNHVRDHGWAVKVPRKLQTQKLAVDRCVEELNQRLGHAPTIPEIAKATGFSEEEVNDTFEFTNNGKPLSLDRERAWDIGDQGSSLLDLLGNEDREFEATTSRMDLQASFGCLSRRERFVMALRFYSDLSQAEVAKRLCISQMQVSRLQRVALNKLKLALSEEGKY